MSPLPSSRMSKRSQIRPDWVWSLLVVNLSSFLGLFPHFLPSVIFPIFIEKTKVRNHINKLVPIHLVSTFPPFSIMHLLIQPSYSGKALFPDCSVCISYFLISKLLSSFYKIQHCFEQTYVYIHLFSYPFPKYQLPPTYQGLGLNYTKN